MRLDHALGTTGGAAAEQPDRRIVAMRVERRELAWSRLEARRQFIARDGVQPRRSWKVPDLNFEQLQPIGRHERRAGSGVFEEVAQQLRRRIGVHHDGHAAGSQDAEQRRDEVDAVRQRHDHAFFRPDVVRREHVRELRRPPLHVGVREGARVGADGDAIAASLRNTGVEQVAGKVEPGRDHES